MIVSLAMCGSIFAQYESHWSDFYYPDFMFQTPCVAAIEIDGEIVTAENHPDNWNALEIAFFVGDECRGAGVAFGDYTPAVNYLYNGYVEDYGDPFPVIDGAPVYYVNTGEVVTVKMYDHVNGIEYTECTITLEGEPYVIYTGDDNDQGWFDPENPIILHFTTEVCPLPGEVTVSDITVSGATVSWTENGTATAWQICLNDDTTNLIDVTTNPYTLTGLTPETVYTVNVRANCGSDVYSFWSSSVSFTTLEVCPQLGELTVSDITASGATVSWTENGTATAWQICLNEDTTNLIDVTTNPYTLTGLTPGTTYTAKVRAYCNNFDQSSWTSAVSFNTAFVIPFVESFNAASAASVPVAWNRYTGLLSDVLSGAATLASTTYWTFGTYNGVFDNHASTYIGNYRCSWLVTPFVLMEDSVELSFDLALTATNGTLQQPQTNGTDDKFVVLITTDGGNTWEILRQWDNAGSEYVYNNINSSAEGENVAIDLSGYAGQYIAIAFYGESTWGNAHNHLHIDNVRIDYMNMCRQPTGLAVTNVTSSSATLSWNENGSATAWQIMLNNDESNIIDVDAFPYTITGLAPGTTYTAKVRAYCDNFDQSSWTSSDSFITDFVIPFVEPFNAESVPVAWNRYKGLLSSVLNGDIRLTSTTSGWWYFGVSNGVFDNHALTSICAYGYTCYDWLVTPFVLMEDSVELSFDLALTYEYGTLVQPQTNGTDDKFVVLITTDGGNTWEILRQWDNAGSEYVYNNINSSAEGENVAIDLSGYAGQYIAIAFYGESTWGNAHNHLHIDNVRIDYMNMCRQPTGLAATDVTSSSATLSWNENGTATAWQVCLNDDTTNLINVTTNPYTLTGLTPETLYTVNVRANCGSDVYSLWSSPVTFTTPEGCPVPEEVSVSDITVSGATVAWTGTNDSYNVRLGWDGQSSILSYFDFENGTIPSQFVNDPTYAWTVATDDNANSHYMRSGNAGVHNSSSAISITVNCPANDTIEFDAECRGEGTWYDVCNFSIDGTSVLSAGANISGWNHYSYPVTAGMHTFTWSYSKDGSVHPSGDYFAVDNIVMGSTEIIWDEPVSVGETEYTFSGLDPETRYYVTVQGVCGEDSSRETPILSFTTQPLCPALTWLVATDIATHSVMLTWYESGTATAWQLCLNDEENNLIDVTTNPYTLTGLTPETAYIVKMRTNCGDDGVSNWSDPVTFTTASCPNPVTLDTAVCASELPLTWHGHAFEEYGSFTDTLTTANGCDSIVTLIVNVSTYCSTLYDGLVAYYPFDDDDFADHTGNGNNGTNNGTTSTSDRFCREGKARNFAGVDNPQYIVVPNSSSLQFTDAATVSMWFCMNGTRGMSAWGNAVETGSGHNLFAKNHDNAKCMRGFNWVMDDGEFFLNAEISNSSAGGTLEGLQIGQWAMATFVYTTTYIETYINGQLLAHTDGNMSFESSNSRNLIFGRYVDYWYPLNGKLDDIRIFNRALSPNEVEQLYLIDIVPQDSLLVYLPFNGNVTDYSGNNFEPVLHGNVTPTIGHLGGDSTAYYFPGESGSWIEIPNDDRLNLCGSFTVSAWYNLVAGWQYDGRNLVSKGRDVTQGWLLDGSSVNVNGDSNYGYGGKWAFASTTPVDGNWYMTTGVYDAETSTLRYYLNGELQEEIADCGAPYATNFPVAIGRHLVSANVSSSYAYPFKGEIDDIVIYNRPLSAEEVQMLYAYNPHLVDCSSLTCSMPASLSVTDVTAYTTTLTWNESGSATAWQLCLNDDTTNLIDVTTNPYTLTGLTPETVYTVKMRANCDSDGYSTWSNPVAFTTASCPDPVTIDTTVCPSELPLTWHGHTFEEYGSVTETLTTADGCDSIVILTVKTPFYLMSDDFNDGVIDPNKWTYTGNTVIEEEGLLKMQQNVTDQDVHLRSVSMDVPDDGKVDIDRRFMVHRNSQYYYGSNYLYFNGDNNSYIQLQYTYAEYYDNAYHHSDPMNGIYVYSRVGGVESNVRICDIEFDTWLTEHVELDFITGTMSYYMDTLVATVNIPGLSSQTVDSFCVQYHPYGWWTGHQHYMDYVEIHAGTGTVRTSPASNVAYTTATCGGDVAPNECVTYTATGVCWSTSQNPTLSDAHTTDGTGVGVFTSELTGLEEGTTYYVRAYALGGTDTVYGQMVSFTTCRHFSTEFADAICEGELPYIWNDVPYNASGDYVQTFTTAANCDSMVTLHLTVLPPPTVEIVRAAGYSATVCEGSSTAIEAVVTGGYGEVTYVWLENGNPLEFNAVLNIGNLTPGADNLYTVEVAQVGSSCYNSASVALNTLVTVYPQFTVSASAPTTVCDNATLTLTATAENASSADELTYQWNGVPSETSGANAATYTSANLQAGSYDCFVAVTGNVSGCYAESEPVHVEILPTYHTTQYDTICHGFDYDFFGQSLTETGSYIHTLQAANGCDSVITLELTVFPKPVVTISRVDGYLPTVCEGSATAIEAVVTGGYGEITSYQWYKNGSLLPGESNAVLNIENLPADVNDLYTVEVVQTGSGCANTASTALNTLVTVVPVYSVGINASETTVCEGNTLTLNANVEGVIAGDNLAYQWYQNVDGGPVAISGANTTTYSTSDLLPGNTYEYFMTVTSSIPGCSVVSSTLPVSVVVLPTVTIAGATSVDLGHSITLTASGANTYTWSDGSANIGNSASVTVSPEVATTYSVTGTDQYGCTGSASVSVIVKYPPTVTTDPVSDITAFSATCGGNVTANGGANVTARGVCWSTAHNPTITDAHTTNGTGTGAFTSAMTGLMRGTTYYVRAYATNRVGTAYGEEVAFTTPNCPDPITLDTAVCANNLPLTWHGHIFEEAETLTMTLPTDYGCDSVVTLQLTVLPSTVGEFMSMTPAANQTVSEYPIRFTWESVESASGYDLYVWPLGETRPQEPTASEIRRTQYTIADLPNHTTYQWLMKAYNACDTSTSGVRQFTLNVSPMLTVTSGNPVDFGEVPFNSTRSVFFQVNGTALESSITYQLMGADASSFSLAPMDNWDSQYGGRMQLTFHPTVPQNEYTAQMTFQSGDLVETVTVKGALTDYLTFTTYVDSNVYAMDSEIPIHGQVINMLNEPVAGLDVEVYVKVMEYVRTFPATTDANGQFTVTFTPQHSEAGYYTVGSRRAGSSSTAVHDEFNIPGMMLVSSDWILWNPTLDQADTGFIAVRNRSQIPLTNIQVTPLSLPNGCTLQFLPLNLEGMATGELRYIVSGSVTSTGVNYEEVSLHAVSDEGAAMDFTAWYYCIPQRADLDVLPTSLVTTMTRGKSKVVDFMIYNNGTGSTGNIYVSLPDVPWMSVVGSEMQPSLAAHDSAFVSIRLSADSTTDLVRYTGNFSIHCERGEGVSVPYSITAISDSTGTLVVDVTDEYTWNTNGGHGPHLAGANVTVKGYYSLETVATGVTDANGLFMAGNLPEGWYRLIIRADRHSEYQNVLYITAGDTNRQDIFLSFQAITYSWDVVPTEIEDVYTYVLNVEYETHVPKPVVTMDIDRTLPLLDGCEMGEFNLLATNHGLVAAMDVSVFVPQSDYFVFTPLVSHLDSLPALTTYTIPVTYQRKDCAELRHLTDESGGHTRSQDYYSGITCDKEMFNLVYYYICQVTHWETVISGDLRYDTPQEACGDDEVGPGPGPDIVVNPNFVLNYPSINFPTWSGWGSGGGNGHGYYLVGPPIPVEIAICDPNLTPCQNALNGFLGCVPVLSLSINSGDDGVYEPDYIHVNAGETMANLTVEGVKLALDYFGFGLISSLIDLGENAGCISDIINNIQNIKTCIQSWTNSNTASEIKDRDIRTIYSILKFLLSPTGYLFEYQVNPYLYNVILAKIPGVTTTSNGQRSVTFYEGQITDAGRAEILEACLEMDDSPDVEDFVNSVVDRWNHSIESWNNGYFTAENVPVGYDTNFIQVDTNVIRDFYVLNEEAVSQSYANIFQRYSESVNALQEAMDDYQENQNSSSLCATVTVQFTQRMTMTREAFEGTLTINNGNESNPIQDIDVDFVIRDENGVDCTNLFQINYLSYNNMTGTNGNASLDAQSEGSIIVQFIPTKQAAPEIAKVYSFGGTLSFIDPFTGEYMTNILNPVDIWVHPSPDLYVNYFMQRDILGDDPLTEDRVEPIVPAELGVIIHNRGAGIANNVILETAEPRIIDNEKGLAVDFAMYGAAFNGNERQLGLMAIPFGNIEPNHTGVGEWWFTSTLLGHFISYEAHVIHNNSFGNPDLSLVSSLAIHPLIHTVYAYGNLDDGINDFLVDDVEDYRNYPDSLYFSNGSRTGVAIADSIGFDHYVTPTDTIVQLTLDPSRIGWNYEQTWDPGRGQYKLISCTRNSDQQIIPLSNVWQTFVTLPVGADPVYENRLHIVDTLSNDQPTTYTLVFSLHDIVLAVDTILDVPDSIITTPLSEVTVKFNKPIVDSTFNYLDMSLKCNNGENLLDENLNVEKMDSVTYKLHLAPYTNQSGYYVLNIQTLDIIDADGFNGNYGKRATWIQNINTCQPDSVSITDTVCDSYTWGGVPYTESGIYTRRLFNMSGCDSVVTLHLTVNYSNEGDTVAVACDRYDWYEHTNLTTSGDYTHAFMNVAGCDSVVTLHLTVNHSNVGDTVAMACDRYDWYEHTNLTTSGDYTHTFMNAAGCDSVVTLHLTINHPNTGDTTAVECYSYDWYEHVGITASGDYTHTFMNTHGCDSVVTLHLTVNTCDPDAVVVVIVGNNETDVYDGAEHDVSGYEVRSIMIGGVATTLYTEADFSLAAGVTATASRTDAGRTNMGLSETSFVNDNPAFETVVFRVTDGYQTITPRPVTLTSASDSRVYNGDSLTNHNMMVGGDGFVSGECATYEFTGGQLLPGSSDNTFTYALNDGTQADNYDITTEYGTLTVENRPEDDRYVVEMVSNTIPISIDEPIVYDGLEHTIEDFVTHTFTVNGNIYTVSGLTASVTQIFAGTYDNVIEGTPIVRDVYGNDVTSQFDVQFRAGTLTISKRNISFTIDNEEIATKEFDGTPLTVSFDQLHVEGLAETDTLIAGTITTDNYVVGEYPISEGNEFYMMAAGSSIKSGFKIKHASGALAAALASYTPSFTITLKITPSTFVPCVGVDYRGHHYDAVQIGTQCWLAENLRNTEDASGNAVAHRPVNDDPATVDKFGYLYSWYSAVGVEEGNDAVMPAIHTDGSGGTYVQGICPTNWAVPSHEDVNILRAAIGDDVSVLKDVDPQYWIVGSAGVTPNTGFNARAEGLYNSTTERFEKSLLYAYFWESDSQLNISDVISAVIAYYCDNVMEEVSPKTDLRPVRCIRKVAH